MTGHPPDIQPKEKVNILLVDDQPAKLLSLQAILAPLDENVIQTGSADEALKLLLATDVAVVLVDVCMPKMDGFELAEMIRAHPRFQKTAIIFISAVHLSDSDRLKGYDLGAVDYIPVPIVPEVLRAKVAIFADLYRKTEQLQRLNRQLEDRVQERTADLAASAGKLRESEERFQQIAHTLDQAFWLCEVEGAPRFLYISPGWDRIWGRSSEALKADPLLWMRTVVPEDRHILEEIFDGVITQGLVNAWDAEYRIIRPDGQVVWIRDRGDVLAGSVPGARRCAGVAEDITARKAAEAVLARDRDELERLVAERSAELEQSNERLRIADRMATLGTLSAGLGHDMGNLLLPVRMRLDMIEARELPADVREDIAAIRRASDYLQRLAGSLRLLALDPESRTAEDAPTDLAAWWEETEGMIRNGVPHRVTLSAEIAPGVGRAQIGKAALTQVVFNLVQNAGDSLKGRTDGRVVVAAEAEGDRLVRISVTDNGPGMNEEVRRRCVEPFFTTKSRGLSTGLGLALVSGIIKRAGGRLEIDSQVGKGTCFVLHLPAERTATRGVVLDRSEVAAIEIHDAKLRAHVESILGALSFEVRPGQPSGDAGVWVGQARDQAELDAARDMLRSSCPRCAVLFTELSIPPGLDRVVFLSSQLKPSALRVQLRDAVLSARAEASQPAPATP